MSDHETPTAPVVVDPRTLGCGQRGQAGHDEGCLECQAAVVAFLLDTFRPDDSVVFGLSVAASMLVSQIKRLLLRLDEISPHDRFAYAALLRALRDAIQVETDSGQRLLVDQRTIVKEPGRVM